MKLDHMEPVETVLARPVGTTRPESLVHALDTNPEVALALKASRGGMRVLTWCVVLLTLGAVSVLTPAGKPIAQLILPLCMALCVGALAGLAWYARADRAVEVATDRVARRWQEAERAPEG